MASAWSDYLGSIIAHIPHKQELYIYGAGKRGKEMLQVLKERRTDIHIIGFITTYEFGECCGLPVIRLEDLRIHDHQKIFIASYAQNAIINELKNRNLVEIVIFKQHIECHYEETILSITTKCNSGCIFCSFRRNSKLIIDGIKRKHWTDKYIHDALMISSKAQRIQLTGGEALLHPKIHHVAKWAYENNKDLEIITNGIALSDNKIMYGVVNILAQLTISFSSPNKRIQSYLMPNTDPDMLSLNIKHAKGINKKLKIHFNVIIHKKTLETIDSLPDYMCKSGVDSVTFCNILNSEHMNKHIYSELFLNPEEKKRAREKLDTINRKLRQMSVRVEDAFSTDDVSCSPVHLEENPCLPTRKCVYPWTRTYITLTGTIDPCCGVDGRPVLATLDDYSLLDEKRKELQQAFLTGDLPAGCKTCPTAPPCTIQELKSELYKY